MTGTSRTRSTPTLLGVALVLSVLSVLAGCGGAGGDSGSSASRGVGSIFATLSWAEATGPVDRYRVYLSRNGSGFAAEQDVTSAQARISGDVGERVRIRVAAVDAAGNVGPLSPTSDEILFTEGGAVLAASVTAAASTDAGNTLTRTTASGTSKEGAVDAHEIVPPGEKTRYDFDGDRVADLLWESPEPGVTLRFTSLWEGALRTDLSFERPEGGWWLVGNDDLDGDARTDLLWRDGSGVLAYSAADQLAQTAPTAPLAFVGDLEADERVIATGDLDGDGTGDLLVENEVTGRRTLWLHPAMGAEVALLTTAAAGDQLAATGDFDGDGRTDLLWRGADGTLAVHFMNGVDVEASLAIESASEALATGDFDGDGDDDLLHQDASGAIAVLRMGDRRPPLAWDRDVDPGPAWQVGAVGDYDGDGAADVLWLGPSGAAIGLYLPEDAAPEYVPVDPGGDFVPVYFQP